MVKTCTHSKWVNFTQSSARLYTVQHITTGSLHVVGALFPEHFGNSLGSKNSPPSVSQLKKEKKKAFSMFELLAQGPTLLSNREPQDLFALLPVPVKHVSTVKPMCKYFVESGTGLEDAVCLYINGQCQPLKKKKKKQNFVNLHFV